jgi:hypothetical protein
MPYWGAFQKVDAGGTYSSRSGLKTFLDTDGISGVPACSAFIKTCWNAMSLDFITHF